MNHMQTGSTKLVTLISVLVIAGTLGVAITLLPKGFKSDLTLIGQGKASVVLTHDKNLVGSIELMEVLNDVRSDYEDSVQFLAVDVATPSGQSFLRDQRVGIVELVFFGADGSRLQVVQGGINEPQLRAALDTALGR